MKCEYLQDADGVARVTAVFESRTDMEKFKEVYDMFAKLLPESAKQEADRVSDSLADWSVHERLES